MTKITEIRRLHHLETKYGIEIISLAAYKMDDAVMIVGEICGSETAVTMMGVAYDEDNEILGSQKNESYPSSGGSIPLLQ